MNVRNSIVNRISSVLEGLKILKEQQKITDDSVRVEIQIAGEIYEDRAADAKFTVTVPLN